MKKDTAFLELSRDLSEGDRSDLLKKISLSLNIVNETENNIYEKEMDNEEKNSIINEEINILPLLLRFFLWVKSKLTGKSEKDLYLTSKIAGLKRKIRHQSSNFTGFETRNLTPYFAQQVYNLYSHSMPLRSLFKKLWFESEISKTFFLQVVEERIKNKIDDPFDLLEIDELVEIYGINGKKDDIHRQLLLSLDKYISKIDKKTFFDLELELLPFYYLKDLILFPYIQFFQQFGYTPIDSPNVEKTNFKNASALLCLEDLEKLYCALYSVSKLNKRINFNQKLLDQLNLLNNFESDEESEQLEITGIIDSLSNIIEVSHKFNLKVPISDLIRYFKKNPYFKIMYYLPKIDLKEFYKNTLSIKIIDKLDDMYPEIQKRFIILETEKLFTGQRYSGFQHYREYSSIDYEKLGVSPFSQIRALELVSNYMACFFKGYLLETIRLLERGILSQNRLIKDSMLQYANSIEDVEEKIKIFDDTLSPDSEDGKLFNKFRFSMAKDPIQQKMYRKIVIQKDREAKSLSELGLESISGIKRVFIEILNSNSNTIIEQLDQHYFINNNPTLLKEVLKEQYTHIQQFEHLYHHIIIS
ncbi:MAG: hypothetical protein KAH95_01045 [Spirochaetales bacterium]|nr:hypothetical protein [Spirochaetales bacterium]